MYKVQFKSSNALQSWSALGSYGSEANALHAADRISGRYFMVRVIAPGGSVVYSA